MFLGLTGRKNSKGKDSVLANSIDLVLESSSIHCGSHSHKGTAHPNNWYGTDRNSESKVEEWDHKSQGGLLFY